MELYTRTLGDWLEHWAEATPDKEYIVYSDRNLRFTWRQFNERVDNMAKGLLAIGVKRNTHVGIWAGNVPDWLTFLYACAKIGAVAVTVNTNYKQAELEYLCQNSDMHTLCIVNGDRGSDDYVNMVYAMLPELKSSQRGYLKSKRFPCMKNVIYIGQEKYRGMYNTSEILLLGSNVEDDELTEAKKQVDCHDTVSSRSAPLRELSPLRTVRASFPAYGSSNMTVTDFVIGRAISFSTFIFIIYFAFYVYNWYVQEFLPFVR